MKPESIRQEEDVNENLNEIKLDDLSSALEELIPEEENKSAGATRRTFLKTAAAVVTGIAVGGVASESASQERRTPESKESKESEKQKFIENYRICAGQGAVISDIKKEGVLVILRSKKMLDKEGNQLSPDIVVGAYIVPPDNLEKFNNNFLQSQAEKMEKIKPLIEEEVVKNFDKISKKEAGDSEKGKAIIYEIPEGEHKGFYRLSMESKGLKNFFKTITAMKKYKKEVQDKTEDMLEVFGQYHKTGPATLDEIRSNVKEKINETTVKLNDGGFGYKMAEDGEVKYIKVAPRE